MPILLKQVRSLAHFQWVQLDTALPNAATKCEWRAVPLWFAVIGADDMLVAVFIILCFYYLYFVKMIITSFPLPFIPSASSRILLLTLFWTHLWYVDAYSLRVCLFACGYIHVPVYVCACRGQRLMSGVATHYFFLRWGPHWIWRTQIGITAWFWAPGIYVSPSLASMWWRYAAPGPYLATTLPVPGNNPSVWKAIVGN